MDSNNALATGDSCRCAHHIMLTVDLGGRRVSLTTRMLSRIPNVCNHGCAKTLLQRRVATCIERADGRRLNHGVQQGAFTGGHGFQDFVVLHPASQCAQRIYLL